MNNMVKNEIVLIVPYSEELCPPSLNGNYVIWKQLKFQSFSSSTNFIGSAISSCIKKQKQSRPNSFPPLEGVVSVLIIKGVIGIGALQHLLRIAVKVILLRPPCLLFFKDADKDNEDNEEESQGNWNWDDYTSW